MRQAKSPQDIKDRYRSADFLSGDRVIFDFGGNNYRLNGVPDILWTPGGGCVRLAACNDSFCSTAWPWCIARISR